MNTFYSSNDRKMQVNAKSRMLEKKYADNQQDGIDEMLAIKRGELETVNRYGKLAKGVLNSFVDQIQTPSVKLSTTGVKATTDIIGNVIKSGQLSALFEKLKAMPIPKNVSKTARLIYNDIKNPELSKLISESLNEQLLEITNKQISDIEKQIQIKKAVVDTIAGGKEEPLKELIDYASDGEFQDANETPTIRTFTSSEDLKNEYSGLTGNPKLLIDKLSKVKLDSITKEVFSPFISPSGKQVKLGTKYVYINANSDGLSLVKGTNKKGNLKVLEPSELLSLSTIDVDTTLDKFKSKIKA